MATIDVVRAEIKSKRSAIKREGATKDRIATLTLALEMLAQKVQNQEELPLGSNYESWAAWQEDIEKDLKSAETSLKTIDEYKHLIVALVEYAEANGGEEPVI